MATWKKVIVSGSNVSDLNNDANYLAEGGSGATLSGSFSGSFEGDGSGLTGVVAQAANALTDGNGIADFSYDGNTANVTVAVEADGATLTVGASGVKVSDGGVDTTQLADDAVTSAKIADDAVVTAAIADGAVDADRLAADSVTLGKIADAAFSVTASGDATGEAALSGDAIALSLTLGSAVVDTAQIADDAVTNAKIGVGAVGALEIGDEQVTNAKLADDAVGTAEIANDAVTNAKIASDAVNGDSIADGSISTAMFSGSALVTEAEGIASNDVDTAVPTAAAVKDYVDNNVTAQDLDGSTDSGTFTVDLDSETLNIRGKANRGIATSGSGQVVSIEISDAGVTNAMLAGSIANDKLANSSITIAGFSSSLGGSITADNIIGQVSSGEILLTQLEEDSITIGSTSVTLGTTITAFSGSFEGDGSGLTGVSAQVEESVLFGDGLNGGTFDGSSAVTASINLNGSTLAVGASGLSINDAGVGSGQLAANSVTLGKIADAAFSVTASGDATGQAAITSDAIALSLSLGSGVVDTAELATGAVTDAKIASGSIQNNKLANDSFSVSDGSSVETVALGETLTVRGTANEVDVVLSGGTYTVGMPDDVTISGDLTVLGTASFAEETNLAIADRFILLASGSTSTGDGGIVVQQTTQDVGEVFAFEDNDERWGVATDFNASGNTVTFDAFMAAALSGTQNSHAAISASHDDRYNAAGNIFTSTSDESIWIYS